MIVDSQVHLWKAEAPDRPWPPGGREVAHMAEPLSYQKMLALMDGAGVDRVVIVPPSFEGDRNDYALEAAARYPRRFGVMGRITIDAPEAREQLPAWRAQPGMLGIRLTFSRGKEVWLHDGTIDWLWPAAEAAGIPIMLHPPGFIPELTRIAEKHSGLKLIIDHFGVSRDVAARGETGAAIDRTISLARFPNVFVKTSSAPTYSKEAYPFNDMRDHILRTIEAFGPKRCFWGTDVSISFDKCSYRERVTHFTETLGLNAEEKRLVMGEAICACLDWPA